MFAILHDDDGRLAWSEAPEPVLGPGQLLLRVAATAVNRADLLQRRGQYPPPPGASSILGLEAAGEVLAVGEGVTGWAPGARCMALLSGGGYAERAVVDAGHALPIPENLEDWEAAAIVEVFATAFLNLVELGRLQAGERVLIHGGSGGVGCAAIQLAVSLGAEVWTTARQSKLEAVRALGAAQAFDFTAPDLEASLRAAGRVNVVLDVLGAKALALNLDLLEADGRLLFVGLQGGRRAELDLLPLLLRRLTLRGCTLRALPAERKTALLARFAREVLPRLASGELRPVVHARYPLPDAERAHACMQASEHVGKLVLEVPR
ncbi:MAG: NAD(P)H-quinone oxidoreductase [Planctomycetota bacterium]